MISVIQEIGIFVPEKGGEEGTYVYYQGGGSFNRRG